MKFLFFTLLCSTIFAQTTPIDLPVDFESSTIDYTMTDFGDNTSSLVTDPYSSGNMAMKVIKSSGAATWAGTTIGTPSGFATNIPLSLSNSVMSVSVWSPQAGIPIRLKVEDSNDPTHTCETETNTTVSGWQVMEFDFVNQAPGTESLSVGLGNGWTYNMASIFFNFGTEGTGETYYFDDVQMCDNGDCIDPCEGITCSEGQMCFNGSCIDIPVDPCEGITCEDGQTCEDGECINPDTGIVFSADFGGAFHDNNTYTNPIGSEDWAGFANEDTDLYPFCFSDGGEITFTASNDGTDVNLYFSFEYNPYPDTEPSFNTAVITVSGEAEASYSINIPAQGSNTYSSFLLYLTTLDAPVTLTNVAVASGGCTDPCEDVICVDGQECVDGECIGSVQINLPVDFESSTIDYTMTDFGDNTSSLVTDPYSSGNMAMKVIKSSGAATWAGTTIGTPSGFATNIPLSLSNSVMSVSVWSPQAGIPIRLKVEDSNDPTHTCETETNTTVSGWQVMEFDFVNQAPGTESLSVGLGNGWTYNMASIFFNFGTEGTGETYYFDDVQFKESTIGINDYEINELSIFPNPTNSQWTLNSQNNDITLVEVFDLQGQLVLALSPNRTNVKINASNLVKGLYLSKVTTDTGTSTVKLLKK